MGKSYGDTEMSEKLKIGAACALLVAVMLVGAFGGFSPPAFVEAQTRGGEYWTCSVDDIGNTLTQCAGVPPDGASRYYLTNVVIASTTATGGEYILRYGTGANCATGTTSFFPAAATVVRFGFPGNTAAAGTVTLMTPVSTAPGTAICILCIATNTCSATLTGYVAP